MDRPVILPLIAIALSALAIARGGGGSHSGSHHSTSTYSHSNSKHAHESSGTRAYRRAASGARSPSRPGSHSSSSSTTGTVSRDSHGRIARSEAAKRSFEKTHPCPSTGHSTGNCPGYVVDHIKPLACGGADAPSNMQWQTEAEGKAKDAWERKGCR